MQKLTTRDEDYLGNVVNGLTVSYNNGYIYYKKPSDNYSLYRMKPGGTDNVRLADSTISQVSISGNNMYYLVVFGKDRGIYKSNIDGTGKIKISSSDTRNMQLEGDWIFYSDIQGIHKIKTDGTQDTLITSVQRTDGGVYSINIYNDYIYYTVTEFGGSPQDIGLYRVKLDGSENTKLTEHSARYLWIVPGWIYFDTGSGISRVKLDGTGLEQI